MSTNSDSEIDCQETLQSLLSTKMNKLKVNKSHEKAGNMIKFSPTFGHHDQSEKNLSIQGNPEKKGKEEKYKKNKKTDPVKFTETPASFSKVLKKKGIVLFEKSCISGRKANYNEVKDVPLTQFTGQGLLVLPNGKRYQGEWIEGQLMGTAKIYYPNGNKYVGQTYQYNRHGRGQYILGDKRYVGQFSGNDFHGQGILYDAQNNVLYDGLWRRGEQQEKL